MRKYSKELYSKEVLFKTAFAFTDEMYIHLDTDAEDFLVELTAKGKLTEDEMYSRFENELIAQETRVIVNNRTKNIREMIMARAFSSTVVNTFLTNTEKKEHYEADEILTDWFEKNGE